ncbi:MAG: hypothetical protein ABI426_12005 [Flavobacterium sp.]
MLETISAETANPVKKKSSTSETGHAKNIANFQNLISFCQGYGSAYDPSKEALKISALQSQYVNAIQKLNQTKATKVSFDNATNDRRHEFENLKPLATKIINAFIVSGADNLAIKDLKSINKKIQGSNTPKTKTTPEGDAETVKAISTSQQSYDRLIDHYINLTQVLQQNPFYSPNESELKLSSLNAKILTMQSTNTALINSYTQYSNTIIQRNQALYDAVTGLTQTAKEVKQYVKSVFGAASPQYHQVVILEFKTMRD